MQTLWENAIESVSGVNDRTSGGFISRRHVQDAHTYSLSNVLSFQDVEYERKGRKSEPRRNGS